MNAKNYTYGSKSVKNTLQKLLNDMKRVWIWNQNNGDDVNEKIEKSNVQCNY